MISRAKLQEKTVFSWTLLHLRKEKQMIKIGSENYYSLMCISVKKEVIVHVVVFFFLFLFFFTGSDGSAFSLSIVRG